MTGQEIIDFIQKEQLEQKEVLFSFKNTKMKNPRIFMVEKDGFKQNVQTCLFKITEAF